MASLPEHGRIHCSKCFDKEPEFDKSKRVEGLWRITSNPLAWGNTNAEIIVLGFSKGPTQAGALATTPHNEIAYKGGRTNVAKILSHIGVMSIPDGKDASGYVGEQIANPSGLFHFGSLIRCTVERYDESTSTWKGSGGGMLDKFVATEFGQCVSRNCSKQHLSALSDNTKLIVMFGLGKALNYVKASFELFRAVLGGKWAWVNDVAYTNGSLTVVHVEHFASQGALIPQWMGTDGHPRGLYGRQAREAVASVFADRGKPYTTPSLIKQGTSRIFPTYGHQSITPLGELKVQHKDNRTEVDAEVAEILGIIERSGYRPVNENKKLAEFRSPSGKPIYALKTGATLNNIKVMVHPGLNVEALRNLTGVDSVGSEHRFHSNMPRFPKRLHNGKTETTFGWQVCIGTLGGLESFLKAFNDLSA